MTREDLMKKRLAACAGQYDQEGGWARHQVKLVGSSCSA